MERNSDLPNRRGRTKKMKRFLASICARYCVVWDGDSKIYDGEIQSDALQHILTENKICFAEITNARLMEHNRHGVYKCMKCPKGCTRDCMLRTARKVEVLTGVQLAFA